MKNCKNIIDDINGICSKCKSIIEVRVEGKKHCFSCLFYKGLDSSPSTYVILKNIKNENL